MATKRARQTAEPPKRRTTTTREAAMPALLREIAEDLDEVMNEPLGARVPINPDAVSALDADALETLNETQTVSEADVTSIDQRRAQILSGGDVDASWDEVDAGEETVGGSNPTPGQDVVDDLGRAAGLTYDDSEPLRPEDKVAERDEHRWEVDPASAEDYQDRLRELRGRGARRR